MAKGVLVELRMRRMEAVSWAEEGVRMAAGWTFALSWFQNFVFSWL